MAKKKEKKLKKELQKREKVALQIAIARRRLLLELIDKKKKRVNVLARVEDKIQSVFVNGMHREEPRKEQSFLGRGRLI